MEHLKEDPSDDPDPNIKNKTFMNEMKVYGFINLDRQNRFVNICDKLNCGNNVHCGNCGDRGHVYRKCKKPITSFGIICMRRDPVDSKVKILMVQRKDTMGYVELLRGKYPFSRSHIKILLSETTIDERYRLKTKDFDQLWDELWVNHKSKCYRNEYDNAKEKFKKLPLDSILDETKSVYSETEWGIPKGRRNKNERNIECACREFEEETGYRKHEYELIVSTPLEESFTGTNNKDYKHIYYLAKMNGECRCPFLDETNKNQIGEIRDIEWFSEEEILKLIREYDSEKKKIIKLAFEKFNFII